MSHFISFVRIPLLALRQHIAPLPRLDVLGTDVVKMRVLPNDIDINLHLNNARYLALMDYARTQMLARTGILEHIIRGRWQPLVGASWMTYRRSLPLFARYEIATRMVCWDERWFYLEQTFTGAKGLAAIGWVKGILRNADGNIPPQNVIDLLAPGVVSPPMPDAIAAWNEITKEKLEAAGSF